MTAKTYHSGMPLEDALTSKFATTRVLARLATSAAQDEMLRLITAEANRPDRDLPSLLHGLSIWFIQVHASVAAQFLEDGSAEAAAGAFRADIDRSYVEHFLRSCSHLSNFEGAEQ